ncbi:MAG: FkbM family methyltransferase [Candidatus Giovannonibacteria bacterium]|nr:FkbM family methyltransferase [Candidatus Giovannonibacteria bacterium]
MDGLTNSYSFSRGYSFPKNYIRRWKLDMLWELYERDTVLLFKKIIKPGMAIVDIGAHIGYYTRITADLVGGNGAVYAFEADPDNFDLLKKNTKRLKNVKLYQRAITNKTGTIDFYHYDEKSGINSTLPNVPLNFKKTKISVEARDLDSFFAKPGSPKIDVVKMDIEGGEYAALQGMKKILSENRGLALIVEFAPAWIVASGNTPLNFLKYIESFGFEIFAITPNGLIKIISSDGFTPSSEFINLYCTKLGV